MTGETTEIRSEYPFQISYEDARLRGSLVCLRAESAEALGAALLDVQLALSGALGEPDVPPAVAEPGYAAAGAPPPLEDWPDTGPPPPEGAPRPAFVRPGGPPQPASSNSVATLPMEALQGLMAQKKQVPCQCNAGWWDNRADKRNPRAPDFKCKGCASPVWMTAAQGG